MKTNKNQWQDDAALKRYTMIAPLLDSGIDNARRVALRKKIAEDNNTTIRSLYRYEKAYRKDGFAGLRPSDREKQRSQALPDNFQELLSEAVQLRREVPERSVEQIILILELENRVAPGVLRRSTLERHLFDAGFGAEHMRAYKKARESSSRRFCKPHRMMLAECDIKYGLKLPVGEGGRKVQTYLSALIDDHSRFILESRWYDNQEATIVEDTFHRAILKWGVMDACMADNGKQYVSTQLTRSLERLGIRYMHAKPYHAWSKGLIEKFNSFVDDFLDEVKLKDVKSMDELNGYWQVWVEEYYHNKPHDGIRQYYVSQGWDYPQEGISPLCEWKNDSRRLRYLDTDAVAQAFLHHTQRLVDKGGCISLFGRQYEVSTALIGAKVEVSYDPMLLDTVTVRYQGVEPITAHPLVIKEYCDPKPAVPASMLPVEPQTSRLLDVLERKHEDRRQIQANAISFSGFRKDTNGGDDNV